MKNTKTGGKSIVGVVDKRACCGCGACSVICPQSCIEHVYGEHYNFPKVDTEQCVDCGKCLEVCPSAFLLNGTDPGFSDEPAKASFDCYLIHSPDDSIRLDSSSGGFITALLLHLMNKGELDGGVVARCNREDVLVAESFIAADRESLLSARASKYAPASSCTVLADVLERPGRYAFVGTPCMIQGLRRLQELLPELQDRIVLTIGLVCAGMASREGTRAYIEEQGGVNMADVRRICYRGAGWPGRFRVFGENDKVLMDRPLLGGSLDHVVPHDHYLRCWNCLDHWCRFADIAVSDPWTDEMVLNERKGKSAVMVRTERGREAVASAIDSGDIAAESITIEEMLSYNKHLVIDSKHPRHGWMAGYQLMFFYRLRYLWTVVWSLLRRKRIGLKTTLKARLSRKYYC
ncbi:MAG: Coenzyme F420 hydrogenase/dehydrogenase, beta subunit C-terminal domain [Sedimentisphaerales bacterium]|nr:Coenzyme F420 hydrogenase/dehydrogenase, beta subunit C-terminal domain [Sedimentisphaerales bacterium]